MSQQNENNQSPSKRRRLDEHSSEAGQPPRATASEAVGELDGLEEAPTAATTPDSRPETVPFTLTPSGSAVNPSTSTSTPDLSPPPIGAKRRPVCRPGTVFLLKDNLHVDRKKAVLGVPDRPKLCFSLTSTTGEKIRFPYRGDLPIDWNNPAFINHVNKWRDQIFRRRGLIEQSPEGGVKRRSKYSEQERENLRERIKKQMRSTKRWLSGEDWEIITEGHNRRFKGKKTHVGEKLKSGKRATMEFEIVERSTASLKIQFKRSELKEIEAEIAAEDQVMLAPAATPSPTKRGAGDEEEEDSDEEDGEGVPMGLEEDTDDEMDDQRPAGNTTGGIPVGAY